ncbi:BCL2/adenovirus E1B 19 kDa protein-interacting protein 3 isoform X2 [Protopterus annectens]|uniref:BCL2/adenovirus E1B 19 kDa protein-interacting protein 3 isoform X2 n=1 Tax=Protopterus annectens TaxID=7888 RepID=UPI001CFB233E|nr:BCL2/adenovirus E1B 19 kDa protein-interacting protein 3 isoform X2 [Protopterus annectens]
MDIADESRNGRIRVGRNNPPRWKKQLLTPLHTGLTSLSEVQRRKEEWLQGSWVELHFSSNGNGGAALNGGQEQVPASISIYNGDMEKILLDAQHESGRSSSRGSSHSSSPRPQTPQHSARSSEPEVHSNGEKSSSQSEEDFLERKNEVENILKKNADWIWDWSSRPENNPPKEFLFKHPKRTASLSMRNTSVMKKGGIFSAEFLKVFLPSLILSHLLAVGLGIYIGKRLTASSSTF